MNALESYRTGNGLTFEALAELSKRGKALVWKHCNSKRIPAEAAVAYEASLGIPRWMLRPDLWPAPTATTNPPEAA